MRLQHRYWYKRKPQDVSNARTISRKESREKLKLTFNCNTPSSTPLPAISLLKSFNFLLLLLKLAVLDLCYCHEQITSQLYHRKILIKKINIKLTKVGFIPCCDILDTNSSCSIAISNTPLPVSGAEGGVGVEEEAEEVEADGSSKRVIGFIALLSEAANVDADLLDDVTFGTIGSLNESFILKR